jgi:hypothetical protein
MAYAEPSSSTKVAGPSTKVAGPPLRLGLRARWRATREARMASPRALWALDRRSATG